MFMSGMTPRTFALILLLTPAIGGAQQKRDSVDARRRATSAQARFEMLRRSNLPLE